MTFLRHALKSLPEELHSEVKARVGMDSCTNADRATSTKLGGYASSSTTGMAVSAVTAAAGQLVGGVLGKRASKSAAAAAAGVSGWSGGLVRELVERCLFSLPRERVFLLENVNEVGSSEGERDLSGGGEDEVRSFVAKAKGCVCVCVPDTCVFCLVLCSTFFVPMFCCQYNDTVVEMAV